MSAPTRAGAGLGERKHVHKAQGGTHKARDGIRAYCDCGASFLVRATPRAELRRGTER